MTASLLTLDALGFVVGLLYLWLEYRASIWLWAASLVMPAIDMLLYYRAGLYADFAMAIYYCLAAIYGFACWQLSARRQRRPASARGRSKAPAAGGADSPMATPASAGAPSTAEGRPAEGASVAIGRFPRSMVLPVGAVLLLLWAAIWWVLSRWTNSTVPVTDAFTTALSIVALWALSRRWAEQWLLWLVVDLVSCALYVHKGIPFKACIYGLYTLVAVAGYRKWLRLASAAEA